MPMININVLTQSPQTSNLNKYRLYSKILRYLWKLFNSTWLALLMQEHLAEERKELENQRETYQQDLERLRESTRAVEKEKERLEHQKKIKRKTIEVGEPVVAMSWHITDQNTHSQYVFMIREKARYTYKTSQLAVVVGIYSIHSKCFSLKSSVECRPLPRPNNPIYPHQIVFTHSYELNLNTPAFFHQDLWIIPLTSYPKCGKTLYFTMFKETVKKNPGSAPLVYSEPRHIVHPGFVEICSIVFV